MPNWIYNRSTDSYSAETVCDLEHPAIVKLDLSHSYPGKRWTLTAKTEGPASFKIQVTVPADPENPDISDIKNRAEYELGLAIANMRTLLEDMAQEIARDSTNDMPDRLTMARNAWAEYKRVPKTDSSTDNPRINENWRNFNAGCITKYIEKWFMDNFGLTQEQLDELKAEELAT